MSPNLQVGVEGSGWLKNSDGLERRIATASLVLVMYPSRTGGFFIRAGAGGIRAVIDAPTASLVGEGAMFSGGLGFDIPLGTGAAITPYATYYHSTGVAASVNGISLGADLNPNTLQFGIGITIP